jgi:hypothetical protein
MSTYSIRERTANLAGPEAYPGQRDKLLASLIESDAAHAAEERERAAEARHGGRQITDYLQTFRGDPAKVEAFDEATWSYSLAPSGEGASADRLAHLAKRYASGENDPHTGFPPRPRILTLDAAEAMLAWPIYRAGYTQSTEDCQSRGHVEFEYGPPDISESELRALDGNR